VLYVVHTRFTIKDSLNRDFSPKIKNAAA